MVEDVLVITGGAGGMGLACAKVLASRGKLLLLDVENEQLGRASATLAAEGIKVHTLRCDVTSPEDVAEVAGRVRALGRFRSLVHTAGVSPEMCDGRTVLKVDLLGSVRITDAVLPLVEPGSSAILFGSIAGYAEVAPDVEALLDDPLAPGFLDAIEQASGKAPIDSTIAYVFAKRGVIRLAERLAARWGAKGGRTVAISPGLIDTPMGRMELERQPIMPMMIEMTPVKRPDQPLPGRAEDIAATVAFLESDDAAFITGCDIRVDGGLIGVGRHLMTASSPNFDS